MDNPNVSKSSTPAYWSKTEPNKDQNKKVGQLGVGNKTTKVKVEGDKDKNSKTADIPKQLEKTNQIEGRPRAMAMAKRHSEVIPDDHSVPIPGKTQANEKDQDHLQNLVEFLKQANKPNLSKEEKAHLNTVYPQYLSAVKAEIVKNPIYLKPVLEGLKKEDAHADATKALMRELLSDKSMIASLKADKTLAHFVIKTCKESDIKNASLTELTEHLLSEFKSDTSLPSLRDVEDNLRQLQFNSNLSFNDLQPIYERLHTHVENLKKELAPLEAIREGNVELPKNVKYADLLLRENAKTIQMSETIARLHGSQNSREFFVRELDRFFDKTLPSLEKFASKADELFEKHISRNQMLFGLFEKDKTVKLNVFSLKTNVANELEHIGKLEQCKEIIQALAAGVARAKKNNSLPPFEYNQMQQKLDILKEEMQSLGFDEYHIQQMGALYNKELYSLYSRVKIQ